jgi:hypothetical protein
MGSDPQGLTPTAWQWRWSSAGAYLGLARPPAWLRTDAILEMFGPQRAREPVSGFPPGRDRCGNAGNLRQLGSDPAGLTPGHNAGIAGMHGPR